MIRSAFLPQVLVLLFGLTFAGAALGAKIRMIELKDEGDLSLKRYLADMSVPELINDAEGNYVRTTLAKGEPIDGLSLKVSELEGGKVYRVTSKVRGKGTVKLGLYTGGKQWAYGSAEGLSAEWREITMLGSLNPKADTATLYGIALGPNPEEGYLEMKEIAFELQPSISAGEVPIPPTLINLMDYAQERHKVAPDEETGEETLVNFASVPLKEIPFPQTASPVTIYLLTKPSQSGLYYQVVAKRGEQSQAVREYVAKEGGDWQWIAFPAVSIQEIGDSFGLSVQGGGAQEKPQAELRRVVISTDAELGPESLDMLQP